MDKIKGTNILIGKEPGKSRLLINLSGTGKTAAIGTEGSVPGSVSRYRADQNMAHAKLEIEANGGMRIHNLKPENVTYVNGKEVVSKKVTIADSVQLGKDKFNISLPVIIETAVKLAHAGTKPEDQDSKNIKTFNIRHLERIFEEYEEEQERIVRKQQELQRKRMLPIMFGSASSLAAPVLGSLVAVSTLWVTVPIAAASFGMYIINYRKKDTSFQDRKAASEKFIDDYVCPNPECNKFLGNISYKLLKKQYGMQCPYCKSKFIE